MQLKDLYTQKGELVTDLEIIQEQLQNINKEIMQIRNAKLKTETEKTSIAQKNLSGAVDN